MVVSADAILTAEGLTKSYGDIVAVQDLALSVRRGEVFGFLGPNGAGKTTTVNMVCGLVRPDAGKIAIDGHSLNTEYRACTRLIGLCPQDLVIWEGLTCLEQLQFVAHLYDLSRREAKAKALELLAAVGLADRQNSLAKTLSGGMKRRLNVALALVHGPKLVILDEPQAGLDPQSRILVREYVRSVAGDVTVIVTTHDMDEADRMADRIAIIDHGRLLVLDTPEELKRQVGAGDVLEIRIAAGAADALHALKDELPAELRDLGFTEGVWRLAGRAVLTALPTLLERLAVHNVPVEDVVVRKTTLEDVFIGLTGRTLRE
jgi:ABC-2 type transport system ATP-binding protein